MGSEPTISTVYDYHVVLVSPEEEIDVVYCTHMLLVVNFSSTNFPECQLEIDRLTSEYTRT